MKKILSNIILIIAVGVFLFSGYKLYCIFSEYNKGDGEYKNIEEIAIKENELQVDEEKEEEAVEQPRFVVDFEALQQINSDVVAWIRFDEPEKINYPVVRCLNNRKYLNTTFEGKKNGAGTLFVDYRNSGDFSDSNTFIYGHNMKNGSMFGQLRKYKNNAFCEEHPYFYIYTPDGKESTYQIFAVSIVKDTSRSYTRDFANDQDFQEYIDYIRDISRYPSSVEVSVENQIVSLSTCTNVSEDERILIHGVKIGEK